MIADTANSTNSRTAAVRTAAVIDVGTTSIRMAIADIDDSGDVLALGRTRRLVSRAQRRALMIRDHGICQFAGCHQTHHLQAHHIIHWRDGGLTDLSNLCLLCSRCHHDLHMGDFDVLMGADGIPTLISGRGPPKSRTG